ncbi:RluA family pseudouridine synthase, partial [Patescibacteria group bacterium]|nr:RluA family pseudouridine synthase [Patescibacteria group bacterium]
MSQNLQFKITLSNQGARLDKFLCGKMPEYSRATIQKMIKEKNILINFKETRSSYKIKIGDIIEIKPPKNKIELSSDPSIKFDIIREEKDFAIISKPAGLVVYPGTKHNEKTLINGLLAVWPEIKSIGEDPLRPGIVHRLDKDTSGIMIIAKNNAAFEYFKNLFKNREVEKTYIALIHEVLKPRDGIIDFPIRRSVSNPIKQVAVKEKTQTSNARPALTRFTVKQYLIDSAGNEYTLLEAKPETGRMH